MDDPLASPLRARAATPPSSSPDGVSLGEHLAIWLAIFWGGAIGAILYSTAPAPPWWGMALLVAPVGILLILWAIARRLRLIQGEAAQLHNTIYNLQRDLRADQQTRSAGLQPSVEKKLDEIATSTRMTESAVAMFTSTRARTPKAKKPPAQTGGDGDQPTLEFENTAFDGHEAADTQTLIRALNFPNNVNDKDGFAALRRALKDHRIAQLIQASQDILTLLSEDGLYMDDLRPDAARPDLWRRFAGGERGAMITAIGGVRDRSSLALTSGRMRQDAKFRETTHNFLRRFDKMLQEFESDLSDAEISALTGTRTARAFMLLGRVNGIFD